MTKGDVLRAVRHVPSVALLATAILTACRQEPRVEQPVIPVRVEAAEPAAVGNDLRYSATIQPVTQVTLAFKVGGYVAEILQVPGVGGQPRNVQQGDRVVGGAVLARVRQADYQVQVDSARSQLRAAEAGESQAVAQHRDAEASHPQAVANLRNAEAGRARAVAQLTSAQASLDKAQRDFARAKNLYETQSLTRADYDTAHASLDGAGANLDAAKAGVESADAQIASARAQLDSTDAKIAGARAQLEASQANVQTARQQLAAAEIPLADTALRVPIDAVVLSRKIEIGTFAQPGAVGFVVANTTPVKVVFAVPENVVRGLTLGRVLPVIAEGTGADPERRGPITSIAPAADTQSRVFQVEIMLPNPRGDLRLGMIVTVVLRDEGPTLPHPVVPLSAVVQPRDASPGYGIFIIEDRGGQPIARHRRVVLGDVLGNRVAVLEGLRAGERVVVSGATLAVDGQPVRILP